ncbi:hypothetical protein PYW07_005111 [Mythimna separata]|uniref:Sperm microtubule inner protein 1 C-terminal domain-containing protein n=1 Tax=Mythimna separata TaxID=271217 RepID=A0AAD8DPM9_MYTSE|nr:hypothetical protein PYW07_005111 [Mythimna separata]
MPLLDITRPEIILVLNEAYDKEKRLRSYWVSKNSEKIQEAATLTREPTNYYEQDVMKHAMIAGMATITRDHKIYTCNKRKVPLRDAKSIPGIETLRHEHSIINLGVGTAKEDPRLARPDTDSSPDPVMRPVDAKTKKIFFKPKPHFGREKYLHKRAKILPENKYYLPECTSWEYGWRLKDSKMLGKPLHGRNCILQKTLEGRVGPTRNPDHYRTPMVVDQTVRLVMI